MNKIRYTLDSVEEIKLISLDESDFIKLYSSKDLILISSIELMRFVYKNKATTNIDALFSPVYSSGYKLEIYCSGRNTYYKIGQIVDLLKLKLISRFFHYCKNRDKQERLLQVLVDLLKEIFKNA